MVIDLSVCPTQQGFGELIGVSQQAVSDMISRGVLQPGAAGAEWIRDYCEHLREVAAGRSSDGGGLDLVEERAALAREQKIRLQMQNAVTKKQLAPVVVIEEVLAKAGGKVAGILDAIPGMLKRRVAALTSDDLDLIAVEIAKARNIAAAVSMSDLRDEEPAGEDAPAVEEVAE
jgi:phage terminase Nu1 subunit (DNA packaging protein)